MSNLRIGTVNLTDGANVDLDASKGNYFKLTAAGSRTLNVPTNPIDGQNIIIAHTASGANRTLTLTTTGSNCFKFGTTITGLTATTSGTTDLIGCKFNAVVGKWYVVAYSKGF